MPGTLLSTDHDVGHQRVDSDPRLPHLGREVLPEGKTQGGHQSVADNGEVLLSNLTTSRKKKHAFKERKINMEQKQRANKRKHIYEKQKQRAKKIRGGKKTYQKTLKYICRKKMTILKSNVSIERANNMLNNQKKSKKKEGKKIPGHIYTQCISVLIRSENVTTGWMGGNPHGVRFISPATSQAKNGFVALNNFNRKFNCILTANLNGKLCVSFQFQVPLQERTGTYTKVKFYSNPSNSKSNFKVQTSSFKVKPQTSNFKVKFQSQVPKSNLNAKFQLQIPPHHFY